MSTSVASVLAHFVAGPDMPTRAFPFSRQIGGVWYDIATDAHRILAIAVKVPGYSDYVGPHVYSVLDRPSRIGGVFDSAALIKAAARCNSDHAGLQLRQGERWAHVSGGYLFDALDVMRPSVSVTLGGPRDPVRIEGVLRGTKRQAIAVVMPIYQGKERPRGVPSYRVPALRGGK